MSARYQNHVFTTTIALPRAIIEQATVSEASGTEKLALLNSSVTAKIALARPSIMSQLSKQLGQRPAAQDKLALQCVAVLANSDQSTAKIALPSNHGVGTERAT